MVVMDDDGRRLDGYTISSASKPNSSGELKISEFFISKLPFLVFKSHEKLQDKFPVCHDVVVTAPLP